MRTIAAIIGALAAAAFIATAAPAKTVTLKGEGVFAVMKTSIGDFAIELYGKDAPNTVKNFIELAEGDKAWLDSISGQTQEGKPFYDGTRFHRLLPGFMIQGGDRLNGAIPPDGKDGVGFTIPMERSDKLKFDQPGRVAMARKPQDENSASTQFFITFRPQPQLDTPPNHYAIFGQVIEGLEVLKAAETLPVEYQARALNQEPERSRPKQPIVLEKVTIIRVPPERLHDVELTEPKPGPTSSAFAPIPGAPNAADASTTDTAAADAATSPAGARQQQAVRQAVPPHQLFFDPETMRSKPKPDYQGPEAFPQKLPETKY